MIRPGTGRSLGLRLAGALALLTFLGLAAVCTIVYAVTLANLEHRQAGELEEKAELLRHLARDAERNGDDEGLRLMIEGIDIGYDGMMVRIAPPDGEPLFVSAAWTPRAGEHTRGLRVELPWSHVPGGRLVADLRLDTAGDARLMAGLAATLAATALAGAVLIALVSFVLVRRAMAPVRHLSTQLRRIRPGEGKARLDGRDQPRELQPLVERFNVLLDEVDTAYAQLAAFNADVAHELRTPLSVLIADSEVMLSRARPPHEWRDAFGRHLEVLRDLATIIGDMLFLARTDRAVAERATAVTGLAALAEEVIEFHEAAFEEQQLSVDVVGDASGRFDIQLLKRAVSNLLSNAARYATPGSVVQVRIEERPDGRVRIAVRNHGPVIAAEHLPRLFERFYRVEEATRADAPQHHGLGLAIVAGIARMHGGQPFARSSDGVTEIGLELADGSPGATEVPTGAFSRRRRAAPRTRRTSRSTADSTSPSDCRRSPPDARAGSS